MKIFQIWQNIQSVKTKGNLRYAQEPGFEVLRTGTFVSGKPAILCITQSPTDWAIDKLIAKQSKELECDYYYI